MERIVHKSLSFKKAQQWDIQQQQSLSLRERLLVAKELKKRVYGNAVKDVRECHRKP